MILLPIPNLFWLPLLASNIHVQGKFGLIDQFFSILRNKWKGESTNHEYHLLYKDSEKKIENDKETCFYRIF